MGLLRRLLLYCSPAGLTMACYAGDAAPPAMPAHGPQIMLYFRQPLGASGGHRVYGLRLDQGSAPVSVANPAVLAPLRRREIVNFEVGKHVGMHLELGHRLVWDVSRGEFAFGSIRPSVPFRLPAQSSPAAAPIRSRP
jgi:hypothetical protein